ncbi:MAG: fluoride efflux transporter CrcB [Alcaligenaceae bacterium]|nr:fluoride efflux transporter CrcB [Alcaligenaceae bacterium]
MYLSFISVGLGAMLGAWLRWGISLQFNHYFSNIALGTVMVNLFGGFIIGFVVSFLANSALSYNYKLFMITGFCGALTTFSAFSIEVVALLQSGKYEYALLSIAIHVIGSLLFTLLGIFTYQMTLAN